MNFLAPVIIHQKTLDDLLSAADQWTRCRVNVTENRDRGANLPYTRCTIGVDVRFVDDDQSIQNYRAWQRQVDLWPGDDETKATYDGFWNTANTVANNLRAELTRREIAISAGIIEMHGITPIRGEEWEIPEQE